MSRREKLSQELKSIDKAIEQKKGHPHLSRKDKLLLELKSIDKAIEYKSRKK